MDKEEGQNEVRRGGTREAWLEMAVEGRREEGGEQVEMEPAGTGQGAMTRGTWGDRAMGSASQLPILLVTLEDIPKGLQGFWGKEVDAAVDDVTDKRAGFLHIVQDLRTEQAGVRSAGAMATIP